MVSEYTYKCSHGTNAGPGSPGWWRSPTSSVSPSSSSWPSWSSCFHSSLLSSFFFRRYFTEPEGSYSQAKLARYPGRFISKNEKTTSRHHPLLRLPLDRANSPASFGIDLVSFNALLFGCFALNRSTLDRSTIRNKNGFIERTDWFLTSRFDSQFASRYSDLSYLLIIASISSFFLTLSSFFFIFNQEAFGKFKFWKGKLFDISNKGIVPENKILLPVFVFFLITGHKKGNIFTFLKSTNYVEHTCKIE